MSNLGDDFDRIIREFYRLKPPSKTPSIYKQRLNNALLLYMSQQALVQHYPELHWRLDAEDYMAKHTNDFNLIEYRLTDVEIEAFEAWLARDKITMPQALNYCAEKDIKTSFTFSEGKGDWCISLTGREGNRFNAGATLTTWSDDPIEAFFMAIYKSTIIFEDGKWQTRKSSSRG